MSRYGFDGWDVVERFTRHQLRPDDEQPEGQLLLLDGEVVSRALLIELERPPWHREIDAERRALAKELA